jgi:protein-S-isoprenylcysteine O-methyltransferase Ste14
VSAGASLDADRESLEVHAVSLAPGLDPTLHAGVLVPAPFYFAAALLLAWPLHRFWPITFVRGPAADGIGAALCLAVALVSALGVRALRRAGTSIRPDRPVHALVTDGPFSFSRNPIYLSLAVLVIALGVWTRNGWMAALLPATVFAVNRLVIVREERYLAQRFGERYRLYRSRVRRWI